MSEQPVALEINELRKLVGSDARLPSGSPSTLVRGAFVDSLNVVEGALFFGLRGERVDGGQHAGEALRRGASGVVVTESAWRWLEGEVAHLRKPVIVAKDPLALLQAAGRLALERSGARVAAVTGAVGKTTTKDLLVGMLRAAGVRVHGSIGNRNTEVGVPLTLLDLPEDTQVAVLEMGMRGPGQIAELARLAPAQVGCITAIGPVHLELLGTVEAVAAAKAELIASLAPGATAVVPDGEPLLDAHIAALDPGVTVVRFGDRPDIALGLPSDSEWMLRNAAAALACCRALGYDLAPGTDVPVQLSALRGAHTPLTGGGTLIEDCYNANPLAMAAALRDLAGRSGRRVAVLADMKELGVDEVAFHEEVGRLAGEVGVDLLVAVGPLGAHYATSNGGRSVRFATVEECVAGLSEHLEPGDTVLLKGSRSMALERVGDVLKDL
jgi:UDP-N-acetylmuramoyl-tripeptide--D-alanyl-D-alanine ligase